MAARGSWRRGATTSSGAFATDGQIADGKSSQGRQLQRFDDFVDESSNGLAVQKSGSSGKGHRSGSRDAETFGPGEGGKWDQFEQNERLFGVTTTFDENEYTSKINRDDPNFRKREAEAARMAREIEQKSADDPHVSEERGGVNDVGDDDDGDEEDKFSGVRREALPAMGRTASSVGLKGGDGERATNSGGVSGAAKLSYAAAAAAAAAAARTEDGGDGSSNEGSGRSGSANCGARLSSPPAANRRSRDSLTARARQSGPGRGSPGGLASPGGRGSPRQSDLAAASDAAEPASIINKLSLEAGTPGVGPEVVKRFQDHKIKGDMKAVVQDRDRTTSELKKFASDHVVGRNRGREGGKETAKAAIDEASKAASSQDIDSPKGSGDSGEEEIPDVKESDSKPKSKRTFKFNPDARAFSLNASAPEFVPGGCSASASQADSSSDASVRIPSSPGPAEAMYPHDTAGMHMAAAAAAAAAAGMAPLGYAAPGQYHPSYGMPQMPHMAHPSYPYALAPQFQPGAGAPRGAYYPGSGMHQAMHYSGPPGPYPPQGGMAPGYAMPIGQPVMHPGARQGQGGYMGAGRGPYPGPPQSHYGGPVGTPGNGGGRGGGGHRKSSKQYRQHQQHQQQPSHHHSPQRYQEDSSQEQPLQLHNESAAAPAPGGKVGKKISQKDPAG